MMMLQEIYDLLMNLYRFLEFDLAAPFFLFLLQKQHNMLKEIPEYFDSCLLKQLN